MELLSCGWRPFTVSYMVAGRCTDSRGNPAAAGDFILGGVETSRNALGIVGDIGHDDQNVHILFKGQIFRGGQRHTGRADALNGRVVGKVREKNRPVDGPGALKLADKELRFLKGNTDGSKHHGKVRRLIAAHLGLTGNLSGEVRVRQAGAGENRQLLPANQRVQSVDGGNAGLDKFVGSSRGRRGS